MSALCDGHGSTWRTRRLLAAGGLRLIASRESQVYCRRRLRLRGVPDGRTDGRDVALLKVQRPGLVEEIACDAVILHSAADC